MDDIFELLEGVEMLKFAEDLESVAAYYKLASLKKFADEFVTELFTMDPETFKQLVRAFKRQSALDKIRYMDLLNYAVTGRMSPFLQQYYSKLRPEYLERLKGLRKMYLTAPLEQRKRYLEYVRKLRKLLPRLNVKTKLPRQPLL